MIFLGGMLDGMPYTITIEDGALMFQCGEGRHIAQRTARLLDHLTAQGLGLPSWQLPPEAMERLNNLSFQGSYIIRELIGIKGHWDLVTADDIHTAVQQKIEPGDIQEAIRTLLLGRIKEDTP